MRTERMIERIKNNRLLEGFFGEDDVSVPLLGVQGAGKTYFLFSLGYLVSERDWGSISDQEGSIHLGDMLSTISQGGELRATRRNRRLKITVDEFTVNGSDVSCDFTIYTEDFSGGEFTDVMNEVSEMEYFSGEGGSDDVEKFQNIFAESDGLIVIVDIVRGLSKEEFRRNEEEHVHKALTEQVKPLANGIELAIDANSSLKGKPIFLIFTKADVHQLSVNEISEYFDKYMAIPMRRLENEYGCNLIKHTVSSVGWSEGEKDEMLNNLEEKGFTDVLMDMEVMFNEEEV